MLFATTLSLHELCCAEEKESDWQWHEDRIVILPRTIPLKWEAIDVPSPRS